MIKKALLLIILVVISSVYTASAQDTVKQEVSGFHFQQTIITQDKPGFKASYSGQNSLLSTPETQTSITTTFFGNLRLWKGSQVIFDPELSGGAGLSETLGVAGFPNGETFRVGGTQNKIYIGRLFFQQTFAWGKEKDTIEADELHLAGTRSERYFTFGAGKFNMGDFFDNNSFSHDPRGQFMNWALMDNAAWDYPANTRGYVLGVYAEYGQPDWALRFAITASVTHENSSTWDPNIARANTLTTEYERRYLLNGQKGTLRVLAFLNNGRFGNYLDAIAQNATAPVVDSTQQYGRHKYGAGINAEQYLSKDFGVFAKGSWNDGHTETWFFTEIDRSLTFGGTLSGNAWKRKDDEMALGFILNGLSAPHRQYLADGGYGFIIGDGRLKYAPEMIMEFYYKLNAYQQKFFITPDYQFILHPAYNQDRGPVSVLSLRAHIEF